MLAKVPDLKVIARTSSFQYKGKNEDLRKIGEALGVSTILEGSVRKSKDQLRITAQLINLSDGSHLWSKTYDRKADDVFKVQDEIALEVVEALKITLTGTLKATHASTENEEAYSLYRQGTFFLDQVSSEGNRKALEFLERSVKLDSNLALAWQAIGTAQFRQLRPNNPKWKKVKIAALKALALDPALPDPHTILSLVASAEYDWPLAQAEMTKAYELDPRNPTTLRNFGRMYFIFGKFDEGIKFTEKAVAIDPVSVNSFNYLGKARYLAGQYEASLAAFNKASELSPLSGSPFGRLDRALITMSLKGPAFLLEQMKSEVQPITKMAATSMAQFELRQFKDADKNLADLIMSFQNESAYEIATVYANRNDFENTMLWLERAFTQSERSLQAVNVDPQFKPFRQHPRFKALMKKMNFPE